MVSRTDVVAAARRIAGHVHRTPVLTSRTIDALLGAEVHFKCENLQRSGAFKIRGATNAVRSLAADTEVVATHSSGNHGAALALAAAEAGLRAIIVVPRDARPSKRAAIERYGAEVVVCKPTLAARQTTLDDVCRRTGATFVPPYDDERIIAGAGTAALELLQDFPRLDQLWVPVGGGGLAAGTVVAAQGSAEVVLAEPALACDAKTSLTTGVICDALPPKTVADGLRTALGRRNFEILYNVRTRVYLASDEGIRDWTGRLAEIMKVVIEPSAAVTLAAMAENRSAAKGTVGVILSGGNAPLEGF
ncbi:MAG: pyridoxal-phosphate dependent enzyme [Gammaproteobacteria bacterium]|nr:pyridoxal-phosphate dependent enzyme [Gammaproteobacteria bacterium]MDE0440904.1 pyridoxal-phosphate dependent enzyme [Gammaproteobacteria bacterium]